MFKIPSLLIAVLFLSFQLKAQQSSTNKGEFYKTVEQHKQLYDMSCIPSSIEMVLKYNKKVNADFYDLQNAWKNKADGTFHEFDGKTIAGIKFTQRFNYPRGGDFPLDSLFKTIDAELKTGRKVIVSLQSGMGAWHIYVLDHRTERGDYVAYSRGFNYDNVLELAGVKEFIKAMQGTDIITYTL